MEDITNATDDVCTQNCITQKKFRNWGSLQFFVEENFSDPLFTRELFIIWNYSCAIDQIILYKYFWMIELHLFSPKRLSKLRNIEFFRLSDWFLSIFDIRKNVIANNCSTYFKCFEAISKKYITRSS